MSDENELIDWRQVNANQPELADGLLDEDGNPLPQLRLLRLKEMETLQKRQFELEEQNAALQQRVGELEKVIAALEPEVRPTHRFDERCICSCPWHKWRKAVESIAK